MKNLIFLFAFLFAYVCQGQTYNELKANRIIALKNLRLPDTITGLKLSDSGSVAVKGTSLWIWNGISWNNTTVVVDTSIIATKLYTQKVVDDTATVLRTLMGSVNTRISGLGVANATNSIDNSNYEQLWQWNTMTSKGLSLFSNSVQGTGGFTDNKLLDIRRRGTNANSGALSYGLYSLVTNTGPVSINYGAYLKADSANENYGLWVEGSSNGIRSRSTITGIQSEIYSPLAGQYTYSGRFINNASTSGGIGYGIYSSVGNVSNLINYAAYFDANGSSTNNDWGIYVNTGKSYFGDSLMTNAAVTLGASDSSNLIPNTRWVKQRIAGLGGGGISDGDKGDVSVTGSGATWTVDNSAITYAKIQDAGANTIIGRDAGTSGILAEISTTRFPLFGSAITGTPSASTYLRGDGTWSATSGSTSLSGLTIATGTNTINNTDFTQEWQWNSLSATGAYGLKLNSTSTLRNASATGGLLQITSTGVNDNASVLIRGIDVNVQNTGTTGQNYAGYFQASGASSNNVGIFGSGSNSGVQGQTTTGSAIYGYTTGGGSRGGYFLNTGTTGTNYGVDASTTGSGASINYGVKGTASGASANYGVHGTGIEYGVFGTSTTANGTGVHGTVTATTGTNNYGVYGSSTGSGANTNYGGSFTASGATTNYGVYGTASTYGVYGSGSTAGAAGVFGINNSTSGTVYGVRGITQGSGATTGYAFHAIASNATTNYAFYAQSGITKINSLEIAVVSHTSPTLTVNATHYFIAADATSNNITLTLPTAVGISGRVYIVKKTDASANTVTIDGDGSETIDGATTNVLTTQNEYHMFVSNGSGWLIIGG